MDENEGNEWNNLLEGPLQGVIFDGVDESQRHDSGRRNLGVDDHTPISIGEITVLFPGEAYPSQIEMMTSILSSINNQGNSLIESPTGSGKTLALLCAVLAWKVHNTQQGGVRRKIFYCTKTHSQISTVVQELKKTAYWSTWFQPRLKVAVLGSRKQHCLNEEVLASADIESSCKKLVRNYRRNMSQPDRNLPTCPYYRTEENDFFATAQQSQEIRDIEDLTQAGTREGTCPFYGSRRQYPDAELVICPYNYIISQYIRESMRINLEDSIVVFDEGHNINKALCAEASFSVRLEALRRVADKCDILKDHPDVSHVISVTALMLLVSLRRLDEIITPESFEATRETILNAIDASALSQRNIENVESAWRKVTDEIEAGDGPILESRAAHVIKKFIDCLRYMYHGENSTFYHLFMSNDFAGKKLNIVCINPSVAFSNISDQTSTITITSGTLTPIETFSQELRTTFSETKSLPQSIPSERYFVSKVGIDGYGESYLPPLNRENRYIDAVIREVGEIILSICEVVPNGVVCFFPSQYFVDAMMDGWIIVGEGAGERSLFDRMRQVKHVVSERDMETPQVTRNLLAQYREHSRQGNGALLLGIHRGKLSEGVDFRDEEARAVINVSIPYIPLHSPEYQARKTLDRNFWTWYREDAFRAVNQALGRSIRHRNDWGAIIMVDPRFFGEEESALLPAWIQGACRTFENFGGMMEGLEGFVEEMQRHQDN